MTQNNPKKHYAWKIMWACIMLKVGMEGACYAAMGNFIAPITAELGCSVSSLTTYTSFQAITMALLYTTAARWVTTKRPGLVIGFATILEAIGMGLMATYQTVEMFYISGILTGIAKAFNGFVTIPILLNMWFKKDSGTVLGTVTAVGTLSSMGYNMLSSQLIVYVGWRVAYVVLTVMGAVISIPAVFLLIKSPKEVGCEPYGAEEASDAVVVTKSGPQIRSLTKKEAFRLPLLYVAWIACIMYSYGSGVAGYCASFATMELGQTVTFGATVSVFSMLGSTLSSLIVGKINDKFGVKAGLIWGAVTITLGFSTIFLSYRNPLFVFPAILIAGLGASMYQVQCPLLARNIVGTEHYSEIWSLMMMVNSLIGGGMYSTIGLFYDKFGTYSGAFIMNIGLYCGAAVLSIIAYNKSVKLQAKNAACAH